MKASEQVREAFVKDNNFKVIKKNNTYSIKQIKTLIEFMKKVSNKFDNKHVFELDKIERIIKIKGYQYKEVMSNEN